jgi:hypothetical protein
VEGAQLGADAGEFLLEPMDRGDQVARSGACRVKVAESLIERPDDELQAVVVVPQPRLAQAVSKRSTAVWSGGAGCRHARLSAVLAPHWAVRLNWRRTSRTPDLS